MRTADDLDKIAARRRFADGAALRIAARMHDHLNRGKPVGRDLWFSWWREEAKAAKAAGLYARSTYEYDAANGLMRKAEGRGWGGYLSALAGGGVANLAGDRLAQRGGREE